MKKALIALAIVILGLVVLLPFASSSPDGLERVTSTFGVQQQSLIWNGLLPDYSVNILGEGYISTLVSGVIGIMIVMGAGLLLGKVMSLKQ